MERNDNREIKMSKYAEYINRSSCRSINEIIDLCHEMLPEQWKSCPWRHLELIHGIGLLASEEALN